VGFTRFTARLAMIAVGGGLFLVFTGLVMCLRPLCRGLALPPIGYAIVYGVLLGGGFGALLWTFVRVKQEIYSHLPPPIPKLDEAHRVKSVTMKNGQVVQVNSTVIAISGEWVMLDNGTEINFRDVVAWERLA